MLKRELAARASSASISSASAVNQQHGRGRSATPPVAANKHLPRQGSAQRLSEGVRRAPTPASVGHHSVGGSSSLQKHAQPSVLEDSLIDMTFDVTNGTIGAGTGKGANSSAQGGTSATYAPPTKEQWARHRTQQLERFDALQNKVAASLGRNRSEAKLMTAAAAAASPTSRLSPIHPGDDDNDDGGGNDARDLASAFEVPDFVNRSLQRREVRVQLRDERDRAAPGFRLPQRVEQQRMIDGFDLVRETNALLDSKSAIATVLHEHKEHCRARAAAENQVARWADRLREEQIAGGDDMARVRAMERDDETPRSCCCCGRRKRFVGRVVRSLYGAAGRAVASRGCSARPRANAVAGAAGTGARRSG